MTINCIVIDKACNVEPLPNKIKIQMLDVFAKNS